MYNVSVGENKPCKWGMSEYRVWKGQKPQHSSVLCTSFLVLGVLFFNSHVT